MYIKDVILVVLKTNKMSRSDFAREMKRTHGIGRTTIMAWLAGRNTSSVVIEAVMDYLDLEIVSKQKEEVLDGK